MSRKLTPGYDLVIVGSGVAGLYGALCAAAEGRVLIVSKGPVLTSSSWLAQGGDRRCDRRRRRARASRRGHARRRTRPLPRERGAGADGRGAGAHRRPRRSRCPLRRRARARGRSFPTARAQRRRCADGTRDLPGARTRRARASAHRRQRARACARALDVRRAMRRPRHGHACRLARARWCSQPGDTRRSGIARRIPQGRSARASRWRFARALPSRISSSCSSIRRRSRARRCCCRRHSAATARCSSTSKATVSSRSWRRATSSRVPSRAQGHAMLDLRPIDRSRFPALMERIVDAGFHPETEPVPVAAAAHYTMGGVVTDLDGATDVPGLYAAGECACTGVHGANRLASNSMLECLVFGRRAALAALEEPRPRDSPSVVPVFDEARAAVTPGAARGAVGGRGPASQRDGLARLTSSPAPAHVARRALRARARGESRRSLPRGFPDRERCVRGTAHRPATGARAGARAVELTAVDIRALPRRGRRRRRPHDRVRRAGGRTARRRRCC